MNNDDVLNAEFYLDPNQNDKQVWFNYEHHNGRFYYDNYLREERQGKTECNQHQAPIISNRIK